MTIPFSYIPPGSGFRVPGLRAEIHAGATKGFNKLYRALLFAQQFWDTETPSFEPVPVGSEADAAELFGRGSHAHLAARAYLRNNANNQPLYVVALDDPGGVETRARGGIDLAGSLAVEPGTLSLGIAGQTVSLPVYLGDPAPVLAARLRDLIQAMPDLPVSARYRFVAAINLSSGGAGYTEPPTVSGPPGTGFVAVLNGDRIGSILIVEPGGDLPNATYPLTFSGGGGGSGAAATVTISPAGVGLEAKNGGTLGNDIVVSLNPGGRTADQITPAGVQVALTALHGGSGVPNVLPALANLGDEPWDWWGHPYTDGLSLTAIETELAARWSWDRMAFALSVSARRGSFSELLAFGASRNSPHQSIWAERTGGSAAPLWEIVGAYLGQLALGLTADPALPLTTLPLVGIALPPDTKRWTIAERNQLYFGGLAAGRVEAGTYQIDRPVTSYQKNELGQPDPSWLDINTGASVKYYAETFIDGFRRKFIRVKAVANDTPVEVDSNTIKPVTVQGEVIAHYKNMVARGICENEKEFTTRLQVARNRDSPNRMDIFATPDFANPLYQFALRIDFFLEF